MESRGQERDCSIVELKNLSEWVANLQESDIPESILGRARWVLVDDLGAILGGNTETQVIYVRDKLVHPQSQGVATIWGPGFPMTDPLTAAEINGMAGCWLELDEGYRLAISHAGIYALPGLLALAEEQGSTVGEVLTALVAGYEVGARLAEAWQFTPLTVHPHGVFSSIATAAACSRLIRAGAEATFQAMLAAAALTIASPFELATQGALVRNVWTGVGASLGLKALYYVESGMLGTATTMYTVFHDLYGASYQAKALDQELGTRFAIEHGYHKAYACCHGAHSALEALLAVRERYSQAIPRKIVVKTHPEGMSLKEKHPKTTLGAKFSLAHAVAATWTLGTGGRMAFVQDTLANEQIEQLRERVVMESIDGVGSPPYDCPAHVAVFFDNGEVHEAFAPCAKGDPPKPFSEEELCKKFIETASGVVASSLHIPRALLHLPAGASVSEVAKVLRDGGKE